MSTKEGTLANLLVESFIVDELIRFVRFGPDGQSLSEELPASSSSVAHFAAAIVDLHRRRGLIDADFFARLKDLKPKRIAEIEEVERMWLSGPGSATPLTHRLQSADKAYKRELVTPKTARIFVSYSHRDRSFVDELQSHLSLLQRQGLIDVWHDSEITAGAEWSQVIDQQLESADIILLLVSASFLASDFCWSVELKRAMERHEANEALVIPVILRPCLWTEAPFAKFQSVPRNGKPISQFHNTDEAWVDVAAGIRKAVQKLTKEGR
jgi:hypothetical protein